MKNAKRSLLLAVLTLAMVVALSGAAFPSVHSLPVSPSNAHASLSGVSDLAMDRNLLAESSVWKTGVADGAGIPGKDDAKPVEASSGIESVIMLFLGICLIAIAMMGKRIFHR